MPNKNAEKHQTKMPKNAKQKCRKIQSEVSKSPNNYEDLWKNFRIMKIYEELWKKHMAMKNQVNQITILIIIGIWYYNDSEI